ncbi:hypothetical protein ACFQS1_10000 [Paractinoplanes rhizophilus]|jgi:hypothetical protein|uniref:Excreted virulence factor EspC (Type VII ESX diderm) n=1 Tax=Paractinoplanes rhizophilus TaxID=1416877 RepID=A0ABW2HM65_9ACTN|nr:hypothetical protein [Actinoplanes sp.]
MSHLADRLDRAADTLATVDRRLPALAIAPSAFGADDAGMPGRLGRELHRRWAAVLEARGREAADLAGRLAEAAGAVRAARRAYAETDEAVRQRLGREV